MEVDGGRPEVRITRHPDKMTNQAQAIFEFDGSDKETRVARFECEVTLEGKSVQRVEDCKSGYAFAQIKGQYLFSVKAIDAVGNSSAPAKFEWTVDRQGPQIDIVAPEIVFVGDHSQIAFKPAIGTSFEEIDTNSVRCYHNSTVVVPCNLKQGIRVPNVQLGESQLRVELSDLAGNAGESSFTWIVERRYLEHTYDLIVDDTDYQVDIVFVLDNSQSMRKERRNLSDKIDGFLDIISGLDYHIGLITTDVGQGGRGRGSLSPIVQNTNTYFIDPSVPLEQARELLGQAFVRTGTGGSATEMGFSTMYNLLTRDFNSRRYKKNIYMKDFLRNGAKGLVRLLLVMKINQHKLT